MARVSTYLNFQGQTEEAFAFHAKAFGTEVTMLSRYSDMPAAGPGELPAGERNLVMHAELPIIGGHVLMATDMLRSMGQQTRIGNNTTLCLDVDSRDEADRLYGALSGRIGRIPDGRQAVGAYWGVIPDRYGIRLHPASSPSLQPCLAAARREGSGPHRTFRRSHGTQPRRPNRRAQGQADIACPRPPS
ncbi:MAG TPA: VOC family protein, partial [Streptosporangiaceae bacterium]|nr:VOC family protein [Streptosporangiaceae bacterium]